MKHVSWQWLCFVKPDILVSETHSIVANIGITVSWQKVLANSVDLKSGNETGVSRCKKFTHSKKH